MESKIHEALGVYFANCYWNNLYTSALDNWRNEKYDNLDEAYRITIEQYYQALAESTRDHSKKYFSGILIDIHKKYCIWCKVDLDYHSFLDNLTLSLIGKRYQKKITRLTTKNEVVRDILTKTLKLFSFEILDHLIPGIIEDSGRSRKAEGVKELSIVFQKFLKLERDRFCALLTMNGKTNQTQEENVLVDKLQNEIRKLLEERAETAVRYNKLVEYIEKLREYSVSQNEIIRKLSEKNEGRNRPDQKPDPESVEEEEGEEREEIEEDFFSLSLPASEREMESQDSNGEIGFDMFKDHDILTDDFF